jgi:hypothetical protein
MMFKPAGICTAMPPLIKRRVLVVDSKGKRTLNRVFPAIRVLVGDTIGWQLRVPFSAALNKVCCIFMGIVIGWAVGICIGPWHKIRTWRTGLALLHQRTILDCGTARSLASIIGAFSSRAV